MKISAAMIMANGTNPFEIGLGDSYVSVAGSTDIAVGIDIGANDREPITHHAKDLLARKKSFAVLTRWLKRMPRR